MSECKRVDHVATFNRICISSHTHHTPIVVAEVSGQRRQQQRELGACSLALTIVSLRDLHCYHACFVLIRDMRFLIKNFIAFDYCESTPVINSIFDRCGRERVLLQLFYCFHSFSFWIFVNLV